MNVPGWVNKTLFGLGIGLGEIKSGYIMFG